MNEVALWFKDAGPISFSVVSAFSACTGLIPSTVPNLAAGPLFGLWPGTALFVCSTVAGSIGSLLLIRGALRPFLMARLQRYESKLQTLNRVLSAEGPFMMVILLRLSPVMPLTVASFALGMTDVGLTPYAIGTLVGILPSSFLNVWVATAGQDMVYGGVGTSSFQEFLTMAGILVTIALTAKVSRLAQKTLEASASSQATSDYTAGLLTAHAGGDRAHQVLV